MFVMEQREQWGTRAGFILAAVGSAVGLGNIWRFPAVAYENGGGAFFVPYLFALLTAGIPLLILEFTLGQKYRGSSPLTFWKINPKLEWLGWWQVLIAFVISTYYAVIIAWASMYAFYAIDLSWGSNTEAFLFEKYLKIGDTPGEFGGIVPNVFIPLLVIWGVVLGILFKGVKKGIELASRIFIPLLVFMFLLIVIRSLSLDGAMEGLNAFFTPDWSTIKDGKVWIAAYGQIFFSLSIAFAIMITYSSYLPKKSDVTNNAFITGFANSGFELLAGIGVFSALGFMAVQSGKPVEEVVSSGVGLAFVVFPEIINQFPAFNELFGFLFFGSLVLAGITSLISILETYIAAIQDKFNVSRKVAVTVGGGLSALASIIYATKGGLYFLDAIDYFINTFGVAVSGLIEVVVIAWILRKLKAYQDHANAVSDIQLGSWWIIMLSVITPIVLGYMTYDNIAVNVKEPYGSYEWSFLLYYGVYVVIGTILLGILLSFTKWKKKNV